MGGWDSKKLYGWDLGVAGRLNFTIYKSALFEFCAIHQFLVFNKYFFSKVYQMGGWLVSWLGGMNEKFILQKFQPQNVWLANLNFQIQFFWRKQWEIKHTAGTRADTRQKLGNFSELPNQNLNIDFSKTLPWPLTLTSMYYIRTKIHNVYNVRSSTGQYEWPVLCIVLKGTSYSLLEGLSGSRLKGEVMHWGNRCSSETKN